MSDQELPEDDLNSFLNSLERALESLPGKVAETGPLPEPSQKRRVAGDCDICGQWDGDLLEGCCSGCADAVGMLRERSASLLAERPRYERPEHHSMGIPFAFGGSCPENLMQAKTPAERQTEVLALRVHSIVGQLYGELTFQAVEHVITEVLHQAGLLIKAGQLVALESLGEFEKRNGVLSFRAAPSLLLEVGDDDS